MKIKLNSFLVIKSTIFILICFFALANSSPVRGQSDEEQDDGSRHICPKELLRNGKCVPKTDKNYVRVAKRKNSGAKNHKYVKATVATANRKKQVTKPQPNGNTKTRENQVATTNSNKPKPAEDIKSKEDLPLTSPKLAITIWKLRENNSDSGGRILSHPDSTPVRIKGDPVLKFGDKVRLAVESPQSGYLYIIDRELYEDGTMSDGHIIFPTTRTRNGNNKIEKGSPIEIPALTDDKIYLEATQASNSRKKLVGEVLSFIISEKMLIEGNKLMPTPIIISERQIDELEQLYAGRVEVFELEDGEGKLYTIRERDASEISGSRLLMHNDPVPQTLYLVENRKNGGLLVTVVFKYED